MLFTSQLKTLTFVDAEHEENILTERKNTFLTFLINFKILHVKKKLISQDEMLQIEFSTISVPGIYFY
jgi:hypothetical protein